jgi:hypothetical protein
MLPAIRKRRKKPEGAQAVERRSKIVKSGTATWRLWAGLGLAGLAILSVVLSTVSSVMLMFLTQSVLMALVGLV